MAETTLEEAGKCAKCGNPGEKVSENVIVHRDLPPGTKAVMFYCRTSGCRWENTAWPVQVRPDGSVPIVDHSRDEKAYPNLVTSEEEQRVVDAVQKQLAQETQPGGGEVRNPNAGR